MTDDEPNVPYRFRRIASRAEGEVNGRMLEGDTRGGWFRDDPVYPPVAAALEDGEQPGYVVPGWTLDRNETRAFVPTDRRLYLVRGKHGRGGTAVDPTVIRYQDVRHVLIQDGDEGEASAISMRIAGEGAETVKKGMMLHDDADPGEAERAVAYVAERRDEATGVQPSGRGAAGGGAGGDAVERLAELADLRDRGALTDTEFAELKQEVLDGGTAPGGTAAGGAAGPGASGADDADGEGEPPFVPSPPAELTRYQSFYDRLGIPDDLPPEDIERAVETAYGHGRERASGADQHRLVEEAYEALVDPDRRERYDGMEHLDYLREEGYSK